MTKKQTLMDDPDTAIDNPAELPIQPEQQKVPETITVSTQLLGVVFQTLGAMKEIPDGHNLASICGLKNAVEGYLRKAGAIKDQ